MFEGIFLRMREGERIRQLKTQFKTAEDLNKKECIKCGFCCNKRTCIPTPKELEKIAEFLKLSIKETINTYFCIDKWEEDYDYCYVKPAGINQLDLLGKFIPFRRSYNEGKCVLLDDNNLCKIHSVRPREAKKMRCWEDYECESPPKPVKVWENNELNIHLEE